MNTRKFIITSLLAIFTLLLSACGSQVPHKSSAQANKQKLANALVNNRKNEIEYLKSTLQLSPKTLHILKVYDLVKNGNTFTIEEKLQQGKHIIYTENSLSSNFLNNLKKWTYLTQIYRSEVSPPIRILQRDHLYLAPSHIDFSKCPGLSTACATLARQYIAKLLAPNEIKQELKLMAQKDPCVNLTSSLKGEDFANACLRKSKGNLQVELLKKPTLIANQWLQILNQ